MQFYIIHYDKLRNRLKILSKSLEYYGLKATWLIQSGFYGKEFIDSYYKASRPDWLRKIRVARRPIIFRPLSKSEIHLAINHFLVLESIVANKDDKAVVLEDDAVLCDDFTGKLSELNDKLVGRDWDIVFINYHGKKPAHSREMKLIENRDLFDYFGTCAYIISKDAARRILEMGEKITLPSDEELKYRASQLDLKLLWVLPDLVQQGSLNDQKGHITGQDARDVSGIKKWIYWRFTIYGMLPRWIRKKILVAEQRLKIYILKIPSRD